jgi:hypothetical protein
VHLGHRRDIQQPRCLHKRERFRRPSSLCGRNLTQQSHIALDQIASLRALDDPPQDRQQLDQRRPRHQLTPVGQPVVNLVGGQFAQPPLSQPT